MAPDESPSQLLQLLQLPDPCLLAVLQCCAGDPCSLFSAARAHSRVHQAAVVALSSLTAGKVTQQRLDSVLLYLAKHGEHVDSMDLEGIYEGKQGRLARLRQLPTNMQLDSMQFIKMHLQMQPGSDFQGLVRAGLPLKQLRVLDCQLLDGMEGLAAALAMLPGLEHLSIAFTAILAGDAEGGRRLPTYWLSGLQQLTYLELALVNVQGPDQGQPALQPLQALIRLVDLRLDARAVVSSSMLSGMKHLTRLEAVRGANLEPAALAAQTQLQHLYFSVFRLPVAAQLLPQLQHLQQLTHLRCWCEMIDGGTPPAAAFAPLTASSKLQHLDLSVCKLPAGVWQHVFPAGRQLPHLTSLCLPFVTETSDGAGMWDILPRAAVPEGSRLVACCPGLQSLDIQHLQYSAEQLAPLQGLSGLHTLYVSAGDASAGIEVACQLTGLRELHLDCSREPPDDAEGLLLQFTHLEQLTNLTIKEGWRAQKQYVLDDQVRIRERLGERTCLI